MAFEESELKEIMRNWINDLMAIDGMWSSKLIDKFNKENISMPHYFINILIHYCSMSLSRVLYATIKDNEEINIDDILGKILYQTEKIFSLRKDKKNELQ